MDWTIKLHQFVKIIQEEKRVIAASENLKKGLNWILINSFLAGCYHEQVARNIWSANFRIR